MNKIKTSLPFCLYKVDERNFNLNDAFNTRIKFIKEKVEPSRRTAGSQNIEFLRDRWGVDGYSKVEIETEKNFSKEDSTIDAKKFSLAIINEFIKLYRFLDEQSPHLSPLTEKDLIEFSQEINGHKSVSFSFGGGITMLLPQKIFEVSNKIEKAISGKYQLPFWKELLLNSQYHFCTGDYRISILESIIALELILSTFIKNECANRSISESEANNFIENVGLTGNIKTTIKLLLEEENLPKEEIFEKCKAGITIRNSIIHKERKSVSEEEVKDTMGAIEKMIDIILTHGRGMDELKLC